MRFERRFFRLGYRQESAEAGEKATVMMGTTDTAVHSIPGDAYDLHSWNIISNIYDELMVVPPGGNKPVPSLATACDWDDDTHYTCKLRSGVKFQDGSDLTSDDVAYSFQRSIEINGDPGVCNLFSSLADSGKWKDYRDLDSRRSHRHVRPARPDATWPYIIATGGAAIVPSDVYPEKSLSPTTR